MGLRDRKAAAEYQAAYRRGERRPRQVTPAPLRLLTKLEREYGQENGPALGRCWEWYGARNAHGYGVIRVDGELMLVHRLSLSIALGRPIREGMYVNHRCDNPPCARPRHLYEGTPSENVTDMYSRDRRRRREEASQEDPDEGLE